MMLHLLPGDATIRTFEASGIEGEIAVCRECLVVGDVSGETLPEFWENRAQFLAAEYPAGRSDYQEAVVREFAKLKGLQSGSEINLWFEYDLFCQVNMWFCLSFLEGSTADIFRVSPITLSEKDVWSGYGNSTPGELKLDFDARVKVSSSDIELGAKLWSAFRTDDRHELEKLSLIESAPFPKLREVCIAAIEKESRPRKIIREIIQDGATDFDSVFGEFKIKAGVYGYGDEQVKKIWQSLLV